MPGLTDIVFCFFVFVFFNELTISNGNINLHPFVNQCLLTIHVQRAQISCHQHNLVTNLSDSHGSQDCVPVKLCSHRRFVYACLVAHLPCYCGPNRKCPWNERNQVWGRRCRTHYLLSPAPFPHTQQNDLSSKRRLLLDKDFFSLKKNCKN